MLKFYTSKLCFVTLLSALCIWTATADASNQLRSAYLGPSVWNEDLSTREINDQLKAHFSEVLTQLEAKNRLSLLTALERAEATSEKHWSKADRQAALIFLAQNRRKQIQRLRIYKARGRFPLNEGQSTDAAPIFVDRNGTHCAVGHLMHLDGKNQEVSRIVNTNNLVRLDNVHGGSVLQWIRTSGLTQEEAAMIQPGYPLDLDANFAELGSTVPVVQANGFTLSDATFRHAEFNTVQIANFITDPTAIDAIFQQGMAALENSNPEFPSGIGVLLGEAGVPVPSQQPYGYTVTGPTNLDDWLYIGLTGELVGHNESIFGFEYLPTAAMEIIEVDYRIRSEQGNFARVNVTAGNSGLNAQSEQSALLLLSKIYSGDSNALLGEARLLSTLSDGLTSRRSTDTVSLSEESQESLRIKTYVLRVDPDEDYGFGAVQSLFNEFEVSDRVLLGDVNLDDVVNFEDVGPFVALLINGEFQSHADLDEDGEVTFLDIQPFVELLMGI